MSNCIVLYCILLSVGGGGVGEDGSSSIMFGIQLLAVMVVVVGRRFYI